MGGKAVVNHSRWNEVMGVDGKPRAVYQPLLDRVPTAASLRELQERLEATLRELGMTFEVPGSSLRNTWFCDLLPQIFTEEEWTLVTRAFQQRVRAFEALLRDVYGPREILREGVLPIPLALGSPHYQHTAVGLKPTHGSYLHLSGLCLARDAAGQLVVKSHYFSHPSGLSYMIQNRRLLARVVPELFRDYSVASIADVPTQILLRLRSVAPQPDPAAVLLTPGTGSAVYSEHSFLARRMGIPLVQGNDLVVLNDTLFLKTVSGLERVDVIYSRLADPWLDPLVFRADSRAGVAGLVNCLRQGNLAMINSVGAQLADDRSFLHFSNAIIRYYLGEWPVLPTLSTYWLGDLDQREMVLDNLDRFQVRALVGEKAMTPVAHETTLLEIRRAPHLYVAQPVMDTVETLCFANGRRVCRSQDHLVYGIHTTSGFHVFDGALTRVAATEHGRTESEHGGGGKDTWVLREQPPAEPTPGGFHRSKLLPSRLVTSRVAEAFYWMGRYLERALEVSRIITVIETLEMEELTSAERKLYRPVWDRLLPPLDIPGRRGRRTIGNVAERYRMMLDARDAGSVSGMVGMSLMNAESLREVISPEAWSPLVALRVFFDRNRWRERASEQLARRSTRRSAEAVTGLIPQFFATAQQSMLLDDGWRFCELGQYVERSVASANASASIVRSLAERSGELPPVEIELSAFLRLIGSRDAYRRIYQLRSEPAPVQELIWQNREMPKSVIFCLERCASLVEASLPTASRPAQVTLEFIENLVRQIRGVDWYRYFPQWADTEIRVTQRTELTELRELVHDLLSSVRELHVIISDNFLNHQSTVATQETIVS
jgi:uncharacterized circularly permuted ATP-grasp superfamily protein/uncharacterized alpha-E superfamily protein